MTPETPRWEMRCAPLYGGRHPGLRRLGDAVVPGRIQLTMTGSDGLPDMSMRLEVRDGRPECVSIDVTAKPGGRGIWSTDMQALNLDELMAKAFAETAVHV